MAKWVGKHGERVRMVVAAVFDVTVVSQINVALPMLLLLMEMWNQEMPD